MRTTAVVPSLGASPVAAESLAALRSEAARSGIAIVWVHQGAAKPPVVERARERLVLLPEVAGFARAANAGLAAVETEFAALVNDDAVVAPGWIAALEAALEAAPRAASAQGVVLDASNPVREDGHGIGWNADWQAIQLGHGEPAIPADRAPFEIFGVSATAALYRVATLRSVARPDGTTFDERLESYYEDVDLAGRLRAGGSTALAVPAARARHRGAATAGRRPVRRWSLIYSNRRLVLMALLGAAYPDVEQTIVARDRRDFARAVAWFDFALAVGIVAGGRRAARLRSAFERPGPPRPPLPELERFRVGLPG